MVAVSAIDIPTSHAFDTTGEVCLLFKVFKGQLSSRTVKVCLKPELHSQRNFPSVRMFQSKML